MGKLYYLYLPFFLIITSSVYSFNHTEKNYPITKNTANVSFPPTVDLNFNNDGSCSGTPITFNPVVTGVADYIDVLLLPYETKMFVTSNYMQQGRYNRFDLGASILFDKMFFGATAVTNPAKNGIGGNLLTSVNLFTGLQYEHLKLGFSYDINTSNIVKTGGVYELLLTYQFNLERKCFGCPNYSGK